MGMEGGAGGGGGAGAATTGGGLGGDDEKRLPMVFSVEKGKGGSKSEGRVEVLGKLPRVSTLGGEV